MPFIQSLRLDSLLSFAPGSDAIHLTGLNVLIGPNGSGKSNLLEAIELLRATPTAFAGAIRDGGGAQEWIWKGSQLNGHATIDAFLDRHQQIPELRYRLKFAASGQRTEVVDEALENAQKIHPGLADVFFYYRYQGGRPAINVRETSGNRTERHLERQSLAADESVLSQRKDPDLYPELTWVGQQFARIQTFREWRFGRFFELRQPQPADLPTDVLLPDARNLGLILNELEHSNASADFNKLMRRFLPRYQRFSTRIQGGTVQFYLHEDGLRAPVPATRLSDGTIRFMALLAILLSPSPPPLACIDEPELGLHPDAVALLAPVFVEASSRMQLIVATHSDALVSALTEEAESVLVCEYLGQTNVRRVDADKLKFWLDKYRLGDVWRMGELGGNP
jgi:predicted ATPase